MAVQGAPVLRPGPGDLQAAGRLSAIRVLVVDDHATTVRVLTRQLQLWGMEVVAAESGPEALEWLQRSEALPDVIVTDMHMPEMDGVAFAGAVRAHPGWERIPLVLLSSGFMPAADATARLFQARLLKPARQNQLFETILRCVSAEDAAAGKPGATAVETKHATVLVADDNAVNLKVACAILLKLGYEVRTATDGREAVEAVAHAAAHGERLDAILMDVNPGQAGPARRRRRARRAVAGVVGTDTGGDRPLAVRRGRV